MKILMIILLCLHPQMRDSAEYCLRITEEQDKQYICPESDSVIRYAVDYYDKYGNKRERTKAHYLLGCVEADLFNRAQAIYELRLAAKLNPDKHNNQQALIYSRLGYLLYEHQLYDEAQEVYQNALDLAKERQDTIDLTHSLMQLGCISLENQKTEDADKYIQEAWRLAQTREEDNYLQATVLTALYRLYRTQNEEDKAEWAARECMTIVPHPTRTWPAMYNLGETLYYKEKYDSACLLLEPILQIDHSYQLRADAAEILEKTALRRGDSEKARTYGELQKALERSAKMSLETTDVLRRELYELENQATKSHKIEIVLRISLVLLMILLSAVVTIIISRYRRRQALKHQIENMQTERQSLIQEEFEASEVNVKLRKIVETVRENPFAKENLDEKDWQQLAVYIDRIHHGIITHLRGKYNLDEDEIHICMMFLLNVPVICIGHFVNGYTRNTIQLKARQIPLRAGAKKGTLLRDWLRSEEEKLLK